MSPSTVRDKSETEEFMVEVAGDIWKKAVNDGSRCKT